MSAQTTQLLIDALFIVKNDPDLYAERWQLALVASHYLAETPDTLPAEIKPYVLISDDKPAFIVSLARLAKACWLYNSGTAITEEALAATDITGHFDPGNDPLAPHSAGVKQETATSRVKRLAFEPESRTCPVCGTVFTSKRRAQVFCSVACRNRHGAQRARQDAKLMRQQQGRSRI